MIIREHHLGRIHENLIARKCTITKYTNKIILRPMKRFQCPCRCQQLNRFHCSIVFLFSLFCYWCYAVLFVEYMDLVKNSTRNTNLLFYDNFAVNKLFILFLLGTQIIRCTTWRSLSVSSWIRVQDWLALHHIFSLFVSHSLEYSKKLWVFIVCACIYVHVGGDGGNDQDDDDNDQGRWRRRQR